MRLLTIVILLAICIYIANGAPKPGRKNNAKNGKRGNSKVGKLNRPSKNKKDTARRQKMKDLLDDVKKNNKKESKRDKGGNSLRKKKEKADKHGNKISRLEQRYNGIKVLNAEVVDHDTVDYEVEILDRKTRKPTGERKLVKAKQYQTGRFIDDIGLDVGDVSADQFDPQGAFKKFKEKKFNEKKTKGKGRKTRHEDAETVIYVDPDTGTSQVAYKVSFKEEGDETEGPKIPTAIVDVDGNILKEWNNLNHVVVKRGTGPGGNAKIGSRQYGVDQDKLVVTELGNGMCSLESDDIKTINLESLWDDSKTTSHTFPCYEQTGDEVNEGYSALNDATFYAQKVLDMYDDWYQIHLPNTTTKLNIKVHYGTGYENAYFDVYNNAIVIGDGDSNFYPLVSLDIIGHEIAHVLTSQNSKLVNDGESGALSESFSDMAGKAVEKYVRGLAGVNWEVGADVTKQDPMRCMDDPFCDGSSFDHVKFIQPDSKIHEMSGIFNKVFYLLSQKLPNDIWDAFDLFYVANTQGKWLEWTDFEEASELLLESLEEMQVGRHLPYGYGWINSDDIVDVLNQVGIDCTKDPSTSYWYCEKQIV